ncbi:MAG: hypothetical protein ABIT58_07275 [Ferruginibacter sp.]
MDPANFIYNRKALLVTKHNKEDVVVPLFKEQLGVDIAIATKFETDQFGSVSGEIEGPDTQCNSVNLKNLKSVQIVS